MRLMKSEKTDQIGKALIAVHSSIGKVPKTKKGNNGNYSSIEDILTAISKPCEENGILVMPIPTEENGRHIMILHLLHPESGQFFDGWWPLDADGNKYITGSQASGSAASYAERYLITKMLRLNLSDETDDDGESAKGNVEKENPEEKQAAKSEFISDSQYWLIINRTKKMPDVLDAIFEDHKITDLKKLPWKKMKEVMALIEANEKAEKDGTR